MRNIKYIGAALLISVSSIAAQADDGWRVARVTGSAFVINQDRSARPMAANAVVEAGQTVSTGPNGRVMLVRGASSLMIAPNSVMAVQTGHSDDGQVVILASTGHLDVAVEKRETRYFSVETPYLAAVVKGTRFSIDAKQFQARVSVAEGSVEVDGFAAGKAALLTAGHAARADRSGGFSLSGGGKPPEIVAIPVRAPIVAPRVAGSFAIDHTASADDGSTTSDADSSTAESSTAESKGKAVGAGRSNAGGNGKSNAGGNGGGNGNAGGNGNGNAGGNGNGNAGGNGNGNAGGNGNGNGNAGGNGNGNGNGHGHN